MKLETNQFKAALARNDRQVGMWSTLCSNIVAESLSFSGLDWVLIDTEHSPNEVPNVMQQLQGMAAGAAAAVVRPAWNDAVLMKRLLDIGANSFLVPFVQNAEEAARAVAATRYPPQGIRGVSVSQRGNHFGRVRDYFERANQEICVLVQVETAAAAECIEEIAAVEGIDGIFIGPSDLAADMSHLGNPKHPDVEAAILKAVKRCRSVGKPAGILAFSYEDAEAFFDAGFTFVAVGSDLGAVTKSADALSRFFKGEQAS